MPRLTVETRIDGELRVGPDAGGNHDEIAFERNAVGKLQPRHVSVAQHGGRARGEMRHKPHLLELAAKHIGGARIELRFHQVRHQMNDVRLEAPIQETAGRLQPQQPSADDGGAPRRRGAAHDALAIVERAKHEHALLEGAVLRRARSRAAESPGCCRWR